MDKTLSIDKEKCIGCGTCAAMAGAIFEIGEDGKSSVANPNGGSEEEINGAISACPAEAISWK